LQQWKVIQAPEHMVHSEQVLGISGTPRIRYPQIIDGRLRLAGDIHDPKYDDSFWLSPVTVSNGPWPAVPPTSGSISCYAFYFAQRYGVQRRLTSCLVVWRLLQPRFL
jgi:hypothetical protein